MYTLKVNGQVVGQYDNLNSVADFAERRIRDYLLTYKSWTLSEVNIDIN